ANFGQRKQFQITSLYAVLMNLKSVSPVPPGTERLFQKKPAAFQILSWKPARILELSLFQGVMWQSADSLNRVKTGLLYFNPIPDIGPAAEKLGGTNNYLLGAMFRFDFLKSMSLYGQAMLDQTGTGTKRKLGIQGGLKMFNLFKVKHLHVQAEFNKVTAFAYSTANTEQAWTHYGQPLAHPLGAGFTELTTNLQYKLGDFFIHGRGTWANISANTALVNSGQSPFLSDINGNVNPPTQTSFRYIDVRLGWMISYASNLNLSAGITLRQTGMAGQNVDTQSLLYLSLRTSLSNIYFDFF
ncbi:MAG: hypothetical protein ACRC3B_06320, partial [Bacteroidia bacterium]